MRLSLILIIPLLLFSCSNNGSPDSLVAYFGGEIDNPQGNFVYLKNSNGKFDTIPLNNDNRFMYKITDLVPGLYEFGHGGEIQIVVIEPNDSIAFRLNTRDFDESLAYTGRGSKKNNYLISLFLEHEDNREKLLKSYHKEPEDFQRSLDSLMEEELSQLELFNEDRNTSELFRSISNSIVKYNYYYYKETYPFGYYGYKRLIHFKDLPEDFYSYRDELDLNDDKLSELYLFRSYIFSFLNNVSLYEFYKDGNHDKMFNKESVAYNIEKLRLIDSLFHNPDIKNYLLRSVTKDYFLESEDTLSMKRIADAYFDISTNERDNRNMRDFLNARLNVRSGKSLPNISLINHKREEVKLYDILDKPTVIYFWATNHQLHALRSHTLMNSLKEEFPNISFIAINLIEYEPEFWKKSLTEYKFNSENEYIFKNTPKGINSLAVDLHRVIIVNENGTILESHIEVFDEELFEAISKLKSSKLIVKN